MEGPLLGLGKVRRVLPQGVVTRHCMVNAGQFARSFFPKASPMLGFSFSLLEGGVERGLTGPWCGRDV